MATRTIANAGGVFSSTSTWVEGAVPTSADDIVDTGTSGTLTLDANGACRSIVTTTAPVIHNSGVTLSIGTSTAAPGNVALSLGGSYTAAANTSTLKLVSTSATQQSLNFNGRSLPAVTFDGVGGSWAQTGIALAISATTQWTFTNGAFTSGNFAITAGAFVSNNSNAGRSLTFGTSVVTLTSTGTTVWLLSPSGLTLSAVSATLIFTGASPFMQGRSQTYGTVQLDHTGTWELDNSGFTCTTLTRSISGAATVKITSGLTITFTNWGLTGTPGKLLTFASVTAASAATLSCAAGTVRFNHSSIKDMTCSGGATFEAYDSINISGNTGISFKAAKKAALCGVG